jgi:hypothetical protein
MSEFFHAVEDKAFPLPNYAPSDEVVWGSRELEPHIRNLDTKWKGVFYTLCDQIQ